MVKAMERWKRAGYLSVGSLALAAGAVGVVLPLIPTVPFLLLAAACFARSSERLHAWLIGHPRLGPPIESWRSHGVISPRAKLAALLTLAISLAFPLAILPLLGGEVPLAARVVTALVGLGVAAFLLSRPSRPPQPLPEPLALTRSAESP